MSFNKSIDVLADMSLVDEVDAIKEDMSTIYSTILVGFAGFTVLIYDHLITFADEVRYIWQAPKGLPAYLFLINRYLTPLGFIVNLCAYLKNWDPETCARYVRYEGAMAIIGINIVGLMMLIRIRALYMRSNAVFYSVAALLALEFVVYAWLLAHGTPVKHIGPRYPCTMVFDAKLKKISGASAWLPLLYDTVVMFLTAYKVYATRSLKSCFSEQLLPRILAEGMVYYSLIFSVTLTLTIMIPATPPGIQNISAQLELLFTVAMMSRITIDLKQHAQGRVHCDSSRHPAFEDEEDPHGYQISQIRFRTMTIPEECSLPRTPRTADEPDLEQNLSHTGVLTLSLKAIDNEVHDGMRDTGCSSTFQTGSDIGLPHLSYV